jgi:SAM-dependent methyltransferase
VSGAEVELLSAPTRFHMANEWYEFADKDHFWFRWRFRVLRSALAGLDLGDEILEIGCGNGAALEQFTEWLGRPVSGCDVNLEALKGARAGLGKRYFYDIHDRRAPWKERFSAVLLLDVLEHIPEPLAFLDSVLFHLAPGGLCVVNVPALPWLYSEYDRVVGHQCRYTRASLGAQMTAAGLDVVAVRFWGRTLLPVAVLRKLLVRGMDPSAVTTKGFEPPNRFAEGLLTGLMLLETAVPFGPPIGTSLVMVARKPRTPSNPTSGTA